jgi:hypothetical protein
VRLQRDPVPGEQPHLHSEQQVEPVAEERDRVAAPAQAGQLIDDQLARYPVRPHGFLRPGYRSEQRRHRYNPARTEPVRQPPPQVPQSRVPGVREVAVVGQQQAAERGVAGRQPG